MITLRPVEDKDKTLLLCWRNDPATRRQSTTTHIISQKEHDAWFTDMFHDPNRTCWIAEKKSTPVGVIRFDKRPWGLYESSWTIAPEHRGHGLGSETVRLAMERFQQPVCARVKVHNTASEKVAQYAGFQCVYRSENYSYWFFLPAPVNGLTQKISENEKVLNSPKKTWREKRRGG